MNEPDHGTRPTPEGRPDNPGHAGVGQPGTGPVVLTTIPNAVARIRDEFPGLEVVDVSKGVPDGVRGDVLFGSWGPHAVEAVATGVQWVQMNGTGIDGLAPEIRSVPLLTSARGASAVGISEYVFACIGAFARRFPENWLRDPPDRWNFQPATALAGATLALFGFGGIAQRVARIALAAEMEVVAIRRHPGPSLVPGVRMVTDVRDLMAVADHLVLAAPATEETRHVVNDATLSMTKFVSPDDPPPTSGSTPGDQPGLHLVNIARGTLIDHDALRRALDAGIVARASLDVTDPEPLPAGHWLYHHPRVFLTPHASWVGPPPFEAATRIFCENLHRWMAREPLLGVVGDAGY